MPEKVLQINPYEVYNTSETRDFLKISDSTMKRWIKKGLIKTNKVGGRYKILGRDILKLISPELEQEALVFYKKARHKVIDKVKEW